MKSILAILKRHSSVFTSVLVVLLAMSQSRAESVNLVESVDYSGDAANPTVITPALQLGTNLISGSVSSATFMSDEDYFQVVLPPNSRLAGVSIKVTNFSTTEFPPTPGYFQLMPELEGNSGSVAVPGNGTYGMSITIGNPNNIILHVFPPFTTGLGGSTYYDYQVELIVATDYPVDGAAIYTAVEITFPSELGKYYQLQCTSELDSETWANVGSPILGEGGTMSTFDTTRLATQRFYRVVKH